MNLQRKEFVYPPFRQQYGCNAPIPSLDEIFGELKTFVESIGPEKIININELENLEYTRWIVWYWFSTE